MLTFSHCPCSQIYSKSGFSAFIITGERDGERDGE